MQRLGPTAPPLQAVRRWAGPRPPVQEPHRRPRDRRVTATGAAGHNGGWRRPGARGRAGGLRLLSPRVCSGARRAPPAPVPSAGGGLGLRAPRAGACEGACLSVSARASARVSAHVHALGPRNPEHTLARLPERQVREVARLSLFPSLSLSLSGRWSGSIRETSSARCRRRPCTPAVPAPPPWLARGSTAVPGRAFIHTSVSPPSLFLSGICLPCPGGWWGTYL